MHEDWIYVTLDTWLGSYHDNVVNSHHLNQNPSEVNKENKGWPHCPYLRSSWRGHHLPHARPSQTVEPRRGRTVDSKPRPCWAAQTSEIWAANIPQTPPVTEVRKHQTDIQWTSSSNHNFSAGGDDPGWRWEDPRGSLWDHWWWSVQSVPM